MNPFKELQEAVDIYGNPLYCTECKDNYYNFYSGFEEAIYTLCKKHNKTIKRETYESI